MPANYRPRVNACNPMNISPEDIAYLELLTILKSFDTPLYAFERVNKWVRYLIKHKILQHRPEGETVTFSTKRDTYMKKTLQKISCPSRGMQYRRAGRQRRRDIVSGSG
jgi:hypothetical protein